ncbi:MAG: ComEC/Rec2 family competence protein [Devosia nanyangense]|uniref:ComEC/Rec2 family competence protein n=1 Tax=Devosia nanyangense TaxID=1228055 RepID=A0A933NUV3_9HYPH|nr:ComEC/Rec2 family competence protein [Devosia nanyangense]
MAETLETGRIETEPRLSRPVPAALPPALRPVPATPRRGLVASATVALDERRLFVLLPFATIAGLIVSIELPSEPQPIVLGLGAGALAVAIGLSLRSLTRLRIIALIAALWAGLCLLPIHGALFGTEMLARPASGQYQARVDEILSETQTEKRVVLSSITPAGTGRAVPVRRARVLIKAGPDLAPGDIIAGPFRFSPVPGPVFPGGFDTQFHAHFDGIGAYGNSTKPPVLVTAGGETAPEHIVDAIRRGISARIDAELPQPSAGVARAIINGDQSAVTDAARDTMATAGIAHVLSVSGLHLTIVAGGVFWVLRLLLSASDGLARRLSVKRVAAVGGMAAALFYFAISGGNVAAFRSTLMILLVFGAVLFGRRALTMRNVAVAGLIVIATDPASVFRPSFQLSFAAVVALVGAYENFRSDRARDASLFAHAWAYARGIVVTSLVAGAATLVFSVYHFQQTSPLGVVGNLATLPLVGFVMMPAALIAVLAMPFGLEQPFLLAMGWSIDRMLEMAAVVAGWSEHLRASPLLTPWALGIGLAALCWFAFFKDRWRLLGPALAAPLVVLFAVDHPPDVLIADTTQAMAVRGSSGLELADGKSQSFALDVWRDTYADPIGTPAAQNCDSVACIGESPAGFTYAIVDDPAGFADECGRADLVVTRGRAPGWCRSKSVIDGDDLAAHGVHWLRWNAAAKTFEIRPAIAGLDRPWRVPQR